MLNPHEWAMVLTSLAQTFLQLAHDGVIPLSLCDALFNNDARRDTLRTILQSLSDDQEIRNSLLHGTCRVVVGERKVWIAFPDKKQRVEITFNFARERQTYRVWIGVES